jgi:hypothetical protein
MWVQPVVEDLLQEIILEKIVSIYRPDINLYNAIGKKGNGYIKAKLRAFNDASDALPHIILTDLDMVKCAPALLNELITFPLSDKLMLRIAEKEADAWIMADRNAFADFAGIPVNKIPLNTQQIPDPKEFLINLARRSRRKIIKDIVPAGTSRVGPGYNPILQDFVINFWDPKVAITFNGSLNKAVKRIKLFMK